MGLAAIRSSAWFALHIRCENCMRDSEREVELPIGDDVPRDPEDLIESAFLEQLTFRCQPCGSVIGRLLGITGGNAYDY